MSKICAFCGRPFECNHHLIFGNSLRHLADEDGLYIDMCNKHHNMGAKTERIHDNEAAEKLSKMLGQMQYERDYVANSPLTGKLALEVARDSFIKRYGKSYL